MSQPGRSPESAQSPQVHHFPAVFCGLLALTAAVRVLGITRPLLGNFATKGCVYAMIARNWAEGRAGMFYPTLDLLEGGSRSLHMLEFPVSAYLTGGLWRMFGGSLDVWGRATAVAFSVASVAVMFLLVRRRHGPPAATAAALVLALSPVSVIYGQSFMLEASLVFFTLATFYALQRWLDTGDRRLQLRHLGWLLAAGACLAVLLLTKIYMLVLVLPLSVTVFRADRIPKRLARPVFAAVLVLSVVPAAFWYAFAYQAASPESPSSQRIFYSVRQSTGAQLAAYRLLGSADFYRQILDDLTGVVLTPVGFMLLLAGLLDRRWRQYGVWLAAMVLLLVALPRKFHEMNYYYMAVLPPLCIVAGLGWQVIQQRLRPGRAAVAVLLVVALTLSLRYAVRPAFVTPGEDRGVLGAAGEVQRLTVGEERVVTIHGTTIDLLYYCDRPGWALEPDDPELEAALEDCRSQGARYVVVVGRGPVLRSPVASGENFRIHRLDR